MKTHTGNLSRVTLSYDMTFFALVRMVLTEEDFRIRKHRCIVHPIKKRPMMDDNDALAYASYVSALLTAYKVEDTVSDEKGLKRAGAFLVSPYASRLKRRSLRAAQAIETIVADMISETKRLEQEHCAIPDMPADAFGKMLGELLSLGLDGWKKTIAYEIGLHTGRFVYLIDAVSDYEEDVKKGAYNPFFYAFAEKDDMIRFRKETLHGVLTLESDAILHAVDLLDFEGKPMFHACIENIITDGMESALSLAVGKEETNGK